MRKNITFIAVILIALIGLGVTYQQGFTNDEITMVSLIDNTGAEVGDARLVETKGGVMINLRVTGLSPDGQHAFHIHENADCTPLDSFTNAGGHYNPTDKSHGMKHPEGQHAGDMPNLRPDENGEIDVQILNRFVTLSDSERDGRAPLYDNNGSAFMIHAGADDHMSQPSGAAGSRIVCGEITAE